jgi:hypothetical protein
MKISLLTWVLFSVLVVAFIGCGLGVVWLFHRGPGRYGKMGTALLMGGLGGLIVALPLWAVGLLYPSEWQLRHLLGPLCIAVPVSLLAATVMYVHILSFEAALDLFWNWVGRRSSERKGDDREKLQKLQ